MRSQTWILGGVLAALCIGGAAAQPSKRGALAAATASLDIDKTLLQQDRERYAELARRRNDATNRLSELYLRLTDAVQRDDGGGPARIEQLIDQVDQAEGDRAEIRVAQRVLVDRITERLRRMALLEQQIQELAGMHQEAGGPLSGSWEMVLLPATQRGSCVLQQSGAVVSGTYELDGGWNGSFQGTLVGTKVYLVRIDSKLGRMMEFEGVLSADGDRMRGSWLNYELAGGEGGSGQWSATRKSTEP